MTGDDSGSASGPTGLPPKLGGKYLPIRHIASGGMGAVYEVEHDKTGERLALKLLKGATEALDATALERFRREARVHALLKNEHIVRVIDADVAPELGGAPFLVMDLLEGDNLADLAGDTPQPASRVVAWLYEIAGALDAAHAAGIVHRDLKPENLFLASRPDGSGIVKILDFGIAKARDGDSGNRTSTGAVVGTPLYMAPEQAAAEHGRIGAGTDIWSIGMIAFRLLTGRPYWSTGNVSMLLAELVSQPVRPPSAKVSRLTPAFDTWFLRSCAREPRERFASVGEQVAALAEALGVELPEPLPSSGARLAPTSPDLSRPDRSARATPVQSISGSVASPVASERGSRKSLALGVGLLVAIGAAAGLLARGGGSDAPAPDPSSSGTRMTTPAVLASALPSPGPSVKPVSAAPSVPPSASAAPALRRPLVARPAASAKPPAAPEKSAPLAPEPKAPPTPAPDPLADPK